MKINIASSNQLSLRPSSDRLAQQAPSLLSGRQQLLASGAPRRIVWPADSTVVPLCTCTPAVRLGSSELSLSHSRLSVRPTLRDPKPTQTRWRLNRIWSFGMLYANALHTLSLLRAEFSQCVNKTITWEAVNQVPHLQHQHWQSASGCRKQNGKITQIISYNRKLAYNFIQLYEKVK